MTMCLLSHGSPLIHQPIVILSKLISTKVARDSAPPFAGLWNTTPTANMHGDEGSHSVLARALIVGFHLHGMLQLQLNCIHLPATRQIRYRLVIFEAAPLAKFSAECAYDPLAAASAEVIAVGSATISATTEI